MLEQLTLLLREELAPYASELIGARLIWSMGTLIASQAGMLSAGGRCKTLDAAADGYVRSEGVGALVLSSCGVARAIAVLCGCAVRQDGRSARLTAPNGSAQRTLLTGALGRASLTASEVVCLELHGTGTGYYLNFFPSPVHLDSDNNLESWTLREIEQLQQQLSGASSANAGVTVLPLRGLALFTRPERDVTHAFFKNEEHGAWDSGMVSEGRGGVDGWATGFHLQSGGASRQRLRTVLDWYRNL